MINVYSSDSCPFCISLINSLKEQGIPFYVKNIEKVEYSKELEALGTNRAVPTTVITNNNIRAIVVGADVNNISILFKHAKSL